MVATLAKDKRDTNTFGARLKALRIEAGMTQAQLGERMGMLATNIARLETGGRAPTWDTVMRLAKVFGVSTDEFVTEGE